MTGGATTTPRRGRPRTLALSPAEPSEESDVSRCIPAVNLDSRRKSQRRCERRGILTRILSAVDETYRDTKLPRNRGFSSALPRFNVPEQRSPLCPPPRPPISTSPETRPMRTKFGRIRTTNEDEFFLIFCFYLFFTRSERFRFSRQSTVCVYSTAIGVRSG